MNRSKRYSPEIRECAVRMVFEPQSESESEWAAMCSISSKIGCTTETLRKRVRRSETDQGSGLCPRCIFPAHRRLAGQSITAYRSGTGCTGTSVWPKLIWMHRSAVVGDSCDNALAETINGLVQNRSDSSSGSVEKY